MMADQSARERLMVRTIQVSLQAALRHGDKATTAHAIAQANRMYDRTRARVTDPAVRAEIDRLQEELAELTQDDMAEG